MITKTLPKAWKAFTDNKKYLILIVLIEFIFLFSLTQLHLVFFGPSAEAAMRAGEIMSQQIEDLPATEMYQLESLLAENDEFMVAYQQLLASMGSFIVAMFFAWIIFKSLLWHLAFKSVHKKMPITTSLLKFSLLGLFWFVIMLAIFGIYSALTGSTTVLPLMGSGTGTAIVLLLYLIIIYFANIGFALIPSQQTFKKSFSYGINKARNILPAFLVNALMIFIVFTLPFNWISTLPLLSLAIIVFITIPTLAFTRLHMITAVWNK